MHMTKFAMLIFLYQPKKFSVSFFTFSFSEVATRWRLSE